MKILVSIATYGTKNVEYLNRVIDEYASFSKYDVDIVVHGTVPLTRSDIEFVKYENPKNTVFLHRNEFIAKQNDYDFFLFTEDDMLIPESTVDTYIEYDKNLPQNYSLGFLRYETTPENTKYLIDLWLNINSYNFIKDENIKIANEKFFCVTNPHQACYIVSKSKLKYIIENSNYLIDGTDVGLETASSGIFTDWYLGTGVLNKVIPQKREVIKKCLIQHLPGNHCNGQGVTTAPEIFKMNTVTEGLLYKTLNL